MDKVHFVLQGYGDLADPTYNGGYKAGLHKSLSFPSLATALWYLETWATTVDEDGEVSSLIDPEDDKVEIHEVKDGKRKLVWCCFGWHYGSMWDNHKIEQGHYLGHSKSVYSELMEDY